MAYLGAGVGVSSDRKEVWEGWEVVWLDLGAGLGFGIGGREVWEVREVVWLVQVS